MIWEQDGGIDRIGIFVECYPDRKGVIHMFPAGCFLQCEQQQIPGNAVFAQDADQSGGRSDAI